LSPARLRLSPRAPLPEKHNWQRVVLHPSVFLVASRFPIVTIWKNNQSDGENAMIERWRAESAWRGRRMLH
jgi:hypothetical protein